MERVTSFGYAAVFTGKFQETFEFYKALGFKVEWSDHKRMAMIKIKGFKLLLHGKSSRARAKEGDLHLHLKVSDADRFYKELKVKKVKVGRPPRKTPWGQKVFEVIDPNGIRWDLYHEVRA